MKSKPFRLIASGLAITIALAAVPAAQQPRVENGAVTAQPAGPAFSQSFRALVASQADVAGRHEHLVKDSDPVPVRRRQAGGG